MHICLFSAQKRDAPLDHPELRNHQITEIVGDLDALASRIKAKNPDVVLIEGFEQNESLLQALRLAANAVPSAALIPIISSPQPEFLLQAMRAGVREVLPTGTAQEIAQAIGQMAGIIKSPEKRTPAKSKSAERIGFLSAKGGDGSSCVSANFASMLAQDGETRVLLMDLAIPFGDVEMYVTSASPDNDLSDITGEVDRLDPTLISSMAHHIADNFDLISSPRSIEKVIRLEPAHVSRLTNIASRSYQFIVYDIGTRFDPIGIQAIEELDRLFIVVTQNVSSIRRADRILQLLEMLGFSMAKVSLITNRFSLKEPIGLAEIENALKQTVHGKLNIDTEGVRESMIKGAPYVSLFPKSDLAKGISSLAEDWLGKPKEEKSVWRRFGIR